MNILDWFKGTFVVNSINGPEINMNCPYCDHPRFYFNIKKEIGFCHRDSCHEKPTIEDLAALVGHGPDMGGYVPPIRDSSSDSGDAVVKFPVSTRIADHRGIHDAWGLEALESRGLTREKIEKHQIYSSPHYIYIPIFYAGRLVQYIGRAINRRNEPEDGFNTPGSIRYDYFPGAKISDYFFNWDFWRWHSGTLILVENTFNAIAWEDYGFTTNFGSHLSDAQLKLLKQSKVKEVVMLWDEGADSQKAERKIKALGIPARSVYIKGQPDDYSINYLKEKIK